LAVHSFHYAENDDSSARSSRYVFCSIGFFPNAGQDIYYLTGVSFPKAAMTPGNGKVLTVTSKNASEKNIYIQLCKINGKVWDKFWFTHKDIENGGTIEFLMGEKPVFKK